MLGTKHDRSSVGVVSTNVVSFVPHHFLEPDPNVGLYVFHQVTKVNTAVCVRERRCNKDSSVHDFDVNDRMSLKREILANRGSARAY